jgi:small subunit ribosomal protein S16
MAVRIRLTRKGKKKNPFYRIVAADSEAPRNGKFLDILGTYDPMKDPVAIKINKEKVNRWLERGAIASESVRAILKKEGLLGIPATTN